MKTTIKKLEVKPGEYGEFLSVQMGDGKFASVFEEEVQAVISTAFKEGREVEVEVETKKSKDGKKTFTNIIAAALGPPPTGATAGPSPTITPDTMSKGDWATKDAMEHRRAIVNTLIMAGRRAVKDSKDKMGAPTGKVEGDKNFFDEARLLWLWVQMGPQKKEEELFPDD